jgi:hypothetical protein
MTVPGPKGYTSEIGAPARADDLGALTLAAALRTAARELVWRAHRG